MLDAVPLMNTTDTLLHLAALLEQRKKEEPNQSYIASLFAKGDDAVLKKIGEEATEVVMAAKDMRGGIHSSKLIAETADLWFHCLAMLAYFDLSPALVVAELERRAAMPGLEEESLNKLRKRENEKTNKI